MRLIVPTVKELCQAAFLNALEHGFHDAENEYGHVPALRQAFELAALARIHSELVEAAEAEGPSEKIPGFSHLVEELADVCIRIFDWCGWAGYDISVMFPTGAMQDGSHPVESVVVNPASILHDTKFTLLFCHSCIGGATEAVRKGRRPWKELGAVVAYLDDVCSRDLSPAGVLFHAILAKMEYNKSRPHMHGKLS